MRIRPATPADAAFVLGLVPDFSAFGLPPWREEAAFHGVIEDALRQALQDGATVLIAEDAGGTPLGFAHLHPVPDLTGGMRGHVSDLAVSQAARGHGVGRALLEAAEAWAAEQGFSRLGLTAMATNAGARRFYARLGYGEDTVGLIKPIAAPGTDRRRFAGRRALLVVDVQQGFDDAAYWGPRDNPECEANVERLIDAARARGDALVFVRHDSEEPGSPLRPGQPGNAFKPCVTGEPDLLVVKDVNASFLGRPALAPWLDAHGIRGIDICGITTNHCCETTARLGGNLGYDVRFVLDATHTFDRGDVPAADLRRLTAVNLDGEFARVVMTDQVAGSA